MHIMCCNPFFHLWKCLKHKWNSWNMELWEHRAVGTPGLLSSPSHLWLLLLTVLAFPSLSLCCCTLLHRLCFDSVLFLCVITVLSVSQGQIDWTNSMLQVWQLPVILSINESIWSLSHLALTQCSTAFCEEHRKTYKHHTQRCSSMSDKVLGP